MESLLLTVADAAALLSVSTDTIKRQIVAGLIPVKRIRTSIRVSRAWVEAFAAESAPILLTRTQVSRKLGVSRSVVDGLRRRGLLTTVKIAGRLRIPAASVAAYLSRNMVTIRPTAKPAPIRRLPVAATVPIAAPSHGMRFSSVRGA